MRFFLERGHNGAAVEVTDDMVDLASINLKRFGYDVPVLKGANRSIPFEDDSFDILLSVNTIHYEGNKQNLLLALDEFRRVLRPGGKLFITTAGASHEIRNNVTKKGELEYIVHDYGFRSDDSFAFFENLESMQLLMETKFDTVNSGCITEVYSTAQLEFYYCLCY